MCEDCGCRRLSPLGTSECYLPCRSKLPRGAWQQVSRGEFFLVVRCWKCVLAVLVVLDRCAITVLLLFITG
ncbi:hypothetical protein BDW60DRAFT_137232 [Aspergillus nidulans var. acristatus]